MNEFAINIYLETKKEELDIVLKSLAKKNAHDRSQGSAAITLFKDVDDELFMSFDFNAKINEFVVFIDKSIQDVEDGRLELMSYAHAQIFLRLCQSIFTQVEEVAAPGFFDDKPPVQPTQTQLRKILFDFVNVPIQGVDETLRREILKKILAQIKLNLLNQIFQRALWLSGITQNAIGRLTMSAGEPVGYHQANTLIVLRWLAKTNLLEPDTEVRDGIELVKLFCDNVYMEGKHPTEISDSFPFARLDDWLEGFFSAEKDEANTFIHRLTDMLVGFAPYDRMMLVSTSVRKYVDARPEEKTPVVIFYRRMSCLIGDEGVLKAGDLSTLSDLKVVAENPRLFLQIIVGESLQLPLLTNPDLDGLLSRNDLPRIASAIQTEKTLDFRKYIIAFILRIYNAADINDDSPLLEGEKWLLDAIRRESQIEFHLLFALHLRSLFETNTKVPTAYLKKTLRMCLTSNKEVVEVILDLHHDLSVASPIPIFLPDDGALRELRSAESPIDKLEILNKVYAQTLANMTGTYETECDRYLYRYFFCFYLTEVTTLVGVNIIGQLNALDELLKTNPRGSEQYRGNVLIAIKAHLDDFLKDFKLVHSDEDKAVKERLCQEHSFVEPTMEDQSSWTANIKMLNDIYMFFVKGDFRVPSPMFTSNKEKEQFFLNIVGIARKQISSVLTLFAGDPNLKLQFLQSLTKDTFPFIDDKSSEIVTLPFVSTSLRYDINREIKHAAKKVSSATQQVPEPVDAALSDPAIQRTSGPPTTPLSTPTLVRTKLNDPQLHAL